MVLEILVAVELAVFALGGLCLLGVAAVILREQVRLCARLRRGGRMRRARS